MLNISALSLSLSLGYVLEAEEGIVRDKALLYREEHFL
jgi:hypothetical protein